MSDPPPAFLEFHQDFWEPHAYCPEQCLEPHQTPHDNCKCYETLAEFCSILQGLLLLYTLGESPQGLKKNVLPE